MQNSAEPAGEPLHQIAASAHTPETEAPIARSPTEEPAEKRPLWMWIARGVLIVLALIKGVPMVVTDFRAVSTDDAYVNGHVCRAAGARSSRACAGGRQQSEAKGKLLVQLNKEPYQSWSI